MYSERMTSRGLKRDRRSGPRRPISIPTMAEMEAWMAAGNSDEWKRRARSETVEVHDLMGDDAWHTWIDPINLARLTWEEIYNLLHAKRQEVEKCAS